MPLEGIETAFSGSLKPQTHDLNIAVNVISTQNDIMNKITLLVLESINSKAFQRQRTIYRKNCTHLSGLNTGGCTAPTYSGNNGPERRNEYLN
jgi:hypothetical protein